CRRAHRDAGRRDDRLRLRLGLWRRRGRRGVERWGLEGQTARTGHQIGERIVVAARGGVAGRGRVLGVGGAPEIVEREERRLLVAGAGEAVRRGRAARGRRARRREDVFLLVGRRRFRGREGR